MRLTEPGSPDITSSKELAAVATSWAVFGSQIGGAD